MELRFLGGAGEIGRSAILVNDALLLDLGTLTGKPPAFPVETPEPEAVPVSHGHLDHVGWIPTLLSGDRRPPIHWAPPTKELTLLLARDTLKLRGGRYDCPFTEAEVKRVPQVAHRHGYDEPFQAAGHAITFFNAGHIPGSAHVSVNDGATQLLYKDDYHTNDQRLVASSVARPPADVLVTESTYADTIHEDRATIEHRFVESLRTTLWSSGWRRVRPAVGRPDGPRVCGGPVVGSRLSGAGGDELRRERRWVSP